MKNTDMLSIILFIFQFIFQIYCQKETQKYIDYFDQLKEELYQPLKGKERVYYIAIEEVIWNYAPNNWDEVNNLSLEDSPAHLYTASTKTTIGTKYYKAQYREYTDSTYSTLKDIPSWQGGMGSILRGEVGDTLKVHVWNKASYNYSMHPHGVFYEFEMEGAVYKGTSNEAYISPGERYTYTWQIHPRAGPGPNDGDSIVWGYHSHITEFDIYAGLYGAILVYKKGKYPSPSSSLSEIVTTVFASDENLSPYLKRTMKYIRPDLDKIAIKNMKGDPTPFYLSNIKHMINGYMLYKSPPSLSFHQNQSITWHVIAWGSFLDIHDLRWDSGKVYLFNRRISQLRLLPASFHTLTFVPDQLGNLNFGFLNGEQGVYGMMWQFDVE